MTRSCRAALLGAPVLGLALALGACGWRRLGVATTDATPAASDTVPDSAAASTSAFVAYELTLAPDDRAEPLKIGNLVLPTDDRGEPIPIGI